MTINDPNAPAQPILLTQADLRPADVLLARGQGIISDVIAAADGGSYSHGALWSGSTIIQATSAGITGTPSEGEFAVYRHKDLNAEGAAQVVRFAESQVGGQYAYTELVMLGLLFSAGLRIKGALLDRALECIGGVRADNLRRWLNERADKKVRVCTELVAASYYATQGHRFALQILPHALRPAPGKAAAASALREAADASGPRVITRSIATATTTTEAELVSARAACLAMLTDHDWSPIETEPQVRTRKIALGTIAFDAASGGQLGVVTPADLQFSPSLEFTGYFTAPKLSVASAQ